MRVRGFTLIEMVLTMVIGGILVLAIAGFVEFGTKGYADSVERQRLQTQAKFVLEKMSRELRHSVPNMLSDDLIIGSSSCINFYPIDYAGFYTISGADVLFVVGGSYSNNQIIDAGERLITNPTSVSDAVNAIELTSANTTVSGAVFTLVSGASQLSSQSVANRYYLFSQQVAYCLRSGSADIVRQQQDLATGSQSLIPVSDSVINQGSFSYQGTNMEQAGLVHINLLFESQGEQTNYQQDVQVLNVP
ncbi:PilW family protein [Vibrio sp.]|uniref:PilW family protein n=1 Tax=Vibrio sp. TaxID=678 RepID=UPI003D0F93D2